MKNTQIAILGCGNLGMALVNGLLKSGAAPENLNISKRNTTPLQTLKEQGVAVYNNNIDAIKNAKIIVLAVKPYDVKAILENIKAHFNIKEQVLVSVATGISIQDIEESLPGATIFRAMPNTAADIGQSMTCISANTTDENNIREIKNLFDSLGKTILIKEELMESATVLAACGVAYVLRFMRSMVQGGIQIGFDAQTAGEIVNQVVKGAAELLIERKQHPESEIDKVTTPKGCTIIGLNEMEHNGFSSSLIKGISCSFKQIEKK